MAGVPRHQDTEHHRRHDSHQRNTQMKSWRSRRTHYAAIREGRSGLCVQTLLATPRHGVMVGRGKNITLTSARRPARIRVAAEKQADKQKEACSPLLDCTFHEPTVMLIPLSGTTHLLESCTNAREGCGHVSQRLQHLGVLQLVGVPDVLST